MIDESSSTVYHVDHIIEIQNFAYVVATALHNIDWKINGLELFRMIKEHLIACINIKSNLNITNKNTNLIKMNIMKTFMKLRWFKPELSLREVIERSSMKNCPKRICETIKKAYIAISSELTQRIELEKDEFLKFALYRVREELRRMYISFKID